MPLELRRIPQEETCPVPDHLLGELYRASPDGLDAVIATVGPETRAMLAIYCSRRAHLASLGLVIAAGCEEYDLTTYGGQFGAALFAKAREAPRLSKADPHLGGRRKITLASGPVPGAIVPFADEVDEEEPAELNAVAT
jgi:hypothetical protein